MSGRQPTREKKWQELKDLIGHAYNIVSEMRSEESEEPRGQRWAATIHPDQTVEWHGVDSGKITVMAMNEEEGIIALKFSGSTFWSGIGMKSYSPAHFQVHQFKVLRKHKNGCIDIALYELFGNLRWPVRKQKKES